MSHVGMWMPKRKDGSNWEVVYKITKTSGELREGVKTGFRVQADAQNFINLVRGTQTFAHGKLTIRKVTK